MTLEIIKKDIKNNNSVLFSDRMASTTLKKSILNVLPEKISEFVLVCIGTDRSTGDSYGPLVGNLLDKKRPIDNVHIYGTLENPVHALNLAETLETIRSTHPSACVFGIDACLGRHRSIGKVNLSEGPVKPGAGVNKELPSVGDFSIQGIVNVSGFAEFFVLQNTRLHLVMSMAEVTADALHRALKQYLSANTSKTT